MSFSNHLRKLAQPVWDAQLTHPFVVALGKGTLAERKFRYYIPFVMLAVLMLLHLGAAPAQEPLIARRRTLGLAGAGLGMLVLAGWTHLEVLLHPDAQGALAYLYLPVILLASMPIGYGLGRVIARMLLLRPSA
ncbi:MAG: hypothetical protein E8D43_12385 [Nitrospira sp.]|nr:MAG: hypothetical protein E8D43_12385 [Nitrospira sp.]